MNLELNNNWIDNVDEKVRNSYIKSIEYIIPFDEEEKKTIEEVIEWIKNI
jgi:AAA+ superfamily predicted ATPase